jgi:chromosomal replication initiation ATPase DnaA
MRQQVDLRMQAHQKRRAFEAKVRALAANLHQEKEPTVNRPRMDTYVPPSVPPSEDLWVRIVEDVAKKYQVTIRHLMNPGKDKRLVRARWEMFYRMHVEVGLSLNEIGRRTGKHHTTVMHGVRRYKQEKARASQEDTARQPLLD